MVHTKKLMPAYPMKLLEGAHAPVLPLAAAPGILPFPEVQIKRT